MIVVVRGVDVDVGPAIVEVIVVDGRAVVVEVILADFVGAAMRGAE